jgi:hypothetical protein
MSTKHPQQLQSSPPPSASFSPAKKQTTTKNKASEKAAPPVAPDITKQHLQLFRLQENYLTVFDLTCVPAGQTAERLFVLDLFACLPVYLPEEGRQVSFSIKGKGKLFQYNNQ